MMAYPPFTSLANVIVRDTAWKNDPVVAAAFGIFFLRMMGKKYASRPGQRPLARLKKEHRFQFLLSHRSDRLHEAAEWRDGVLRCRKRFRRRQSWWIMDPLSLLYQGLGRGSQLQT